MAHTDSSLLGDMRLTRALTRATAERTERTESETALGHGLQQAATPVKEKRPEGENQRLTTGGEVHARAARSSARRRVVAASSTASAVASITTP